MSGEVIQVCQFRNGQLVQLKSGGPRMTVAAVAGFDEDFKSQMIQCIWFSPEDALSSAAFPATVLVSVPEED
jgi:Uncharacterized small protein